MAGTVTASGHFTHLGGDVNKCSNFEGPYPSGIPADSVGTIHVRVHWTISPAHTWTPSRVSYHGSFASLLYPNANQANPGPPYTADNVLMSPPSKGVRRRR